MTTDFFLAAILVFGVAPSVGSFVATVRERWPAGRPLLFVRSQCDSCNRVLAPLQLVPIVSYLAQRGRCRGCGAAIPASLPLIECAAMTIAALALWRADGWQTWIGAAFGWTLLTLALIDWRHLWLPDALTLPLIAVGLGVTAWLVPDRALDHLIAAAIGWLAFTVLAWAYKRWRGRDGMGGGDAKLLAVSGAWLGTAALPNVVLLAALAALLWAVLTRRTQATTALPFGSFLAAAIWAVWLATA